MKIQSLFTHRHVGPNLYELTKPLWYLLTGQKHISQNIILYVAHKKESHTFDMWVSKWWQNFNFGVNSLNDQFCTKDA